MKTLTMEEALEKGYTHFVEEEGERLIKFSEIHEDDRQYYKESKYFIVDMETPKSYSIDADTIKELIAEHVNCQDEMVDDEEVLYSIAFEQDYSVIAEELNSKFEKIKYYEPTDIQVTF